MATITLLFWNQNFASPAVESFRRVILIFTVNQFNLSPPVRNISWRDVLADFIDLADQERRLVSGAEREILNDFLTFVGKNFLELGPFNKLERCAGEPSVRRRLDIILNEVLGTGDTTLPGRHTSVKLAVLDYESEKRLVELRLWPADTLQQANSGLTFCVE